MVGHTFSHHPLIRRQSSRGGFTMVEILVAVFVVVVLGSILIPVVAKSRQAASRTKCANVLRGLGHAVAAFEAEHNTTLPTCGLDKPQYPNSTEWIGWGGIDTNVATGRNTDYMNESGLAKYLGFTSLDSSGIPNEKLRNNYRCPAVEQDLRATKTYQYDYQFNAQLSGMPIDRVDKTGQKGMIVETDGYDDSAYCYYDPQSQANYTSPTNVNPITGAHPTPDKPSSRHGGRGDNCLFADGHVDVLTDNDFTTWDAYYTQGSPNVATQPKNVVYGAAR